MSIEVDHSLGRFHDTDAEGWLRNPAHQAALQPEYAPVLERMAAGCKGAAGASFHSFYVRGSVAAGRAVVGSSDLDTVLVVDDDEGERRPPWTDQLCWTTRRVAPHIPDAEVVVLGARALRAAAADLAGAAPAIAQWVFLLVTGARCLAGDDLLEDLGRFRADHQACFVARSLAGVRVDFDQRLAALGDSAAPEDLQRLASWMAKKLLRAGAELAMLEDGRYTRDLAPAAAQMRWRFPALHDELDPLLTLALDPPSEPGPWADRLRRIADHLVEDAELHEVEQDPVDGPPRSLPWG